VEFLKASFRKVTNEISAYMKHEKVSKKWVKTGKSLFVKILSGNYC